MLFIIKKDLLFPKISKIRYFNYILVLISYLILNSSTNATELINKNESLCRTVNNKLIAFGEKPLAREMSLLLFEAAEKGCGKVVNKLVEKGVVIDTRDRFANTPLMKAADSGHIEILKFLQKNGGNLNHLNLRGKTALLEAIKKNRKIIVNYLLSQDVDVNMKSLDNETPLSAAAFVGNLKFVKSLLEKGADPKLIDDTGKSAIVYAAAKGFYGIVKILIDNGVNVNERYGNDLTVLMWASGHTDDTPRKDATKTIKTLIEFKAKIDLQDDRGMTALMYAAQRNNIDAVDLLLKYGSNKLLKNKDGLMAIQIATDTKVKGILE